MAEALNSEDWEGLRQLIIDCEIVDPISGTRNWTEVRQFNLMRLPPKWAPPPMVLSEGVPTPRSTRHFVNFLNVQKTGRMKFPFGIAQIGKSLPQRNCGSPVYIPYAGVWSRWRCNSVAPGTELEWFEKVEGTAYEVAPNLGFGAEKYRFHDHDKLAHYANAATDIEFEMPFGFKEVEGIHSRTDFDLTQHEALCGKNCATTTPNAKRSYVPYVVETP